MGFDPTVKLTRENVKSLPPLCTDGAWGTEMAKQGGGDPGYICDCWNLERPETVFAVAKAYVDALNAHDCDAARKLSTANAASHSDMWCRNVRSVEVLAWRTPIVEEPKWSGHRAPQEVTFVPVTMTVTWRPFHDDGTMNPGTRAWGYVLLRENATSPWRVSDQGPV